MTDLNRIARWGSICGLLGTFLYVGVIVLSQMLPGSSAQSTGEALAIWGRPENQRWGMLPHMSVIVFALLWMVGVAAMEKLLQAAPASAGGTAAPGRRLGAATFGRLFSTVGFGILVAMLIVQGAVDSRLSKMYAAATGDTERASLVALYRGLRSIDLGLDLAWDGFIFVGIAMFGFAMWRHPWFGRVLGGSGILIGFGALIANTWTAPTPPSFDWGPLCGLWIIAVSIRLLILSRRPLTAA